VALTRAADHLAITWAEKRGGKKAGRSSLLPDLALREPDPSEAPVLLPERPRPAAAAPTADPGAAVLARLKGWRAAAARAAGVPAAFLIDDRSLDRIVTTMPTTQDDLAAIDGIGPLLARRFAERILPLLSEPGGSRPAAQ
jgi:superfamily II DNA helicase RecQ